MPSFGGYYYQDRSEIRRRAEREVRAKFPALIQGSTGWDRAVANRMQRGRLTG